jgi:hypothetical protein
MRGIIGMMMVNAKRPTENALDGEILAVFQILRTYL